MQNLAKGGKDRGKSVEIICRQYVQGYGNMPYPFPSRFATEFCPTIERGWGVRWNAVYCRLTLRLYRPLSLMKVGLCSRPMGSRIVTPSPCFLSSASTWRLTSRLPFWYPSTVLVPSFPTCQNDSFSQLVLIAHITAGLSDGGKNFCCHPALELFCRRQLAWQYKGIQARFVDNGHFLFTRRSVYFGHPSIFGIYMIAYCLSGVGIPKCFFSTGTRRHFVFEFWTPAVRKGVYASVPPLT